MFFHSPCIYFSYIYALIVEMAHEHQLLLLNRGAGLFWGVELVEDRDKRTPATQKAAMLVKRYSTRVLYSFAL